VEGKLKLLEIEHNTFLRNMLDVVNVSENSIQRVIENLIEILEPKEIKKISVELFKLIEEYKRLGVYRCFIKSLIFHYGEDEINKCYGEIAENYVNYRNRVFFMIQKAIEQA